MTNRMLALVVVSCARIVAGVTVACALMVLGGGQDADYMVDIKATLDRLEGWQDELEEEGHDRA